MTDEPNAKVTPHHGLCFWATDYVKAQTTPSKKKEKNQLTRISL